MKRSKTLKLGLMVAAGSGLTACDDTQQDTGGQLYKNAAHCIEANIFDDTDCSTAFSEAVELNSDAAPKFETQNLCEDQFGLGQCQAIEGGGFWAPFLTGYFMSEVIDEVGDAFESKRKRRKYGSHVRPVYRSNVNGNLYSPSGAQIYRDSNGTIRIPKSALQNKPKTSKVVTRSAIASSGGFASRSKSRSSGG